MLAARHQELSALGEKLWLWVERQRLGPAFASAQNYSFSPLNKCPETSSLRNRLVNLRVFGASGLKCGRYPRERLLHSLPLLLWDKNALTDPAMLGMIQSSLRTQATDLAGVVAAYTVIWGRFN